MTISKTSFQFFLPCDPMPAPRPRATTRGGKFASMYHPKAYTDWKADLAEAIRGVNSSPAAPLTGPLNVTVDVRIAKARTSKLAYPTPDLDNLVKGVLDAITQSEKFWGDDKQVTTLLITKAWAEGSTPCPGFEVSIQTA